MQDFALRTYSRIADILIGVQIYGRHCYKNIKAGVCKKIYGPLTFNRRF